MFTIFFAVRTDRRRYRFYKTQFYVETVFGVIFDMSAATTAICKGSVEKQ
jgi:hypothetical protein